MANNTKQRRVITWIPISILIAGILATFFTIARNSRNGYIKMK